MFRPIIEGDSAEIAAASATSTKPAAMIRLRPTRPVDAMSSGESIA
jgi:hypothetical protein